MAVTTRAVSRELGAAQIAFIRFAIGLFCVAGATCWRRNLFQASKFRGLALRGLFGGFAVLGYFMAIERLSAGLGTLLNYTFPLWTSVFAAIFLGERLTIRTAIGMVMAMAGLVVIIGPAEVGRLIHGLSDPRIQMGLLAGMLSSVSGGAATTVVRALRKTESALAIFGAFCAIGMVVCLPMAIAHWKPVSARAAMLLLVIGLLSAGAQTLLSYALKYVSAGAGSITTQLTVVASYTFAALFLGEPIQANVLVGGAVVMSGVLIVALAGTPKATQPASSPQTEVE
jgi:drug/metabolite transporter (DMT)-like permease